VLQWLGHAGGWEGGRLQACGGLASWAGLPPPLLSQPEESNQERDREAGPGSAKLIRRYLWCR
jgi:hypothetical protein